MATQTNHVSPHEVSKHRARYFNARYHGRCVLCKDRIEVGQLITFPSPTSKRVAHVACYEVETDQVQKVMEHEAAVERAKSGKEPCTLHLEMGAGRRGIRVVAVHEVTGKVLVHNHDFENMWKAYTLLKRIQRSGKDFRAFTKSDCWKSPEDLGWVIDEMETMCIAECLAESEANGCVFDC
jgi:hypothetical protein